jgi:hypothetical protein
VHLTKNTEKDIIKDTKIQLPIQVLFTAACDAGKGTLFFRSLLEELAILQP